MPVITQINKTVVHFIVRHNAKFGSTKFDVRSDLRVNFDMYIACMILFRLYRPIYTVGVGVYLLLSYFQSVY